MAKLHTFIVFNGLFANLPQDLDIGELAWTTDTAQLWIGTATTPVLAAVDGTNGTDGTDGADGKTILSGAVAPTTEGVAGDFYLDTVLFNFYGPKAGTGETPWGSPTSLVGPAGEDGTDAVVYTASGSIVLDPVTHDFTLGDIDCGTF